jgi:hypothetical protein
MSPNDINFAPSLRSVKNRSEKSSEGGESVALHESLTRYDRPYETPFVSPDLRGTKVSPAKRDTHDSNSMTNAFMAVRWPNVQSSGARD